LKIVVGGTVPLTPGRTKKVRFGGRGVCSGAAKGSVNIRRGGGTKKIKTE